MLKMNQVVILWSCLFFSIIYTHQVCAVSPTFLLEQPPATVFSWSRQQVQDLLSTLPSKQQSARNAQLAFIMQQLADIPYVTHNTGEGDWQPTAMTYQPGAIHMQPDPVYRLDSFDCQTLVEVVMALLQAHNLAEFEHNFLRISYGAAGNPAGEIVRYDNRNHFVDGDFNPINQRNGRLKDVTSQGPLAPYAATASAIITRQAWFSHQGVTIEKTINTAKFKHEKVTISYLPKTLLAVPQTISTATQDYQPNRALLAKIPTPAVVEIVSDPRIWANGENIKNWIGSETNISHMGLLYRQTFHTGDLMYYRINCQAPYEKAPQVCAVTPMTCQQAQCKELMLAHATRAYPKNYYWYQQSNGNYTCAAQLPKDKRLPVTYCNRVEILPFFAYLTEYQYGTYTHMHNPAFLGVHIEKLL